MTQEIELKQLKACPFCGGHPVMKIGDDPFGNGFQIVRISCTQCHAVSNTYSTGQSAFSEHITTLEEAKQSAVKAWNDRCDEEKRREVFANSLSVAQVGMIMEAGKLWEFATIEEQLFCYRMAKVYGCVPKAGNEDNLMNFLTTIYHYGVVQGIRQERAKRNQKKERTTACSKK